MRKDRLEELAKFLETLPDDRFNMGANAPYYATGTYLGEPGNISGFAIQLFGNPKDYAKAHSSYTYARELLGLTHNQAGELFLCYGWSVILSEVTREQAVGALRYLAQTGIVAWPEAEQKDWFMHEGAA
jgi:hypothetical protein